MTGRKDKNMITSTYDWKINTKEPDAGFFKLAKEHGLAETAAKIAYERGITTEDALEDFLKADLSHLHDPYLLHDMDKACLLYTSERLLLLDYQLNPSYCKLLGEGYQSCLNL